MADLEDGNLYASSLPCIMSDCDSSDAMSIYSHEDGRYNTYCFSCGEGKFSVNPDTLEALSIKMEKEETYNMQDVEEITKEFSSDKLNARRISQGVTELYGVKVGYNDGKQDCHMYPTYDIDEENSIVGYVKRGTFYEGDKALKKHPEKLGKMKSFYSVGNTKPTQVQMFGQNVFPAPSPSNKVPWGSKIFICTGQEDALAGYTMTKRMSKSKSNTGYNFVSVVGGDDGGIKNLKANLKYVSAFDEIFLCCDKDESGKKFEKDACKLLPVGKVKIVNWTDKNAKDLSDLWNKGSNAERHAGAGCLWSSIYDAEDYSPAGIKSLSQGWSSYLHRGEEPLIPFPESFGNLNVLTCGGYGADGEIINIAAPSSVGKSSFVKEMVYTALQKTTKNIGVISLEENLSEFLEGMLSIHMSEQLNEISFDQRDREKEWKSFQELIHLNSPEGRDRVHFLDDPGACRDEDDLWSKVDFLIKGLDCSIIILDPVTLALSLGLDEDDYTSTLVKKVKRHKLAWINVHHVRKSGGGSTANSEGADLAEEDIKGSGSHFQTSNMTLIFTRNKVHENSIVRNTTKIKMSKCRRHGKNTGIAGFTFYNGETGRLELGADPQIIIDQEKSDDESEFSYEDL